MADVKSIINELNRRDLDELERLMREYDIGTDFILTIGGDEAMKASGQKRTKKQEIPEGKKQVGIYLPPALHKWTQFQALKEDTTLSGIITRLLERYQQEVEEE